MTMSSELFAERSPRGSPVYERISRFWLDLFMDGDSGKARWEDLQVLHDQVMDCLMRNPPELRQAESLTAQAALMISGHTEL